MRNNTENLIALMGRESLKVPQVADELGVSVRTVYQWLKGDRKTPNMAVKLLELLHGKN